MGTLTRLINDTIVFAFDPKYEADKDRPILSLSFKGPLDCLVTGKAKTTARLSPFFSNLLPEGRLRDYLAGKLEINPNREFFLLAALGQDLPGAVTATPMSELSTVESETEQKREQRATALRFSLAGVQLKFSAIAEAKGTFTIPADGSGGSWIVKLPSERHLQVPETEYSMLRLAQLVGIEVPEFKLVPTSLLEGLPEDFGSVIGDSLAVRRFDRTTNSGRIHMEDFAQVYGIYPQDKYEKAGYGHIAKVLWIEAGEASYCEFIRRLVFTVAIGNGDMHLKNWSLLYEDPRKPVLSPAYDFVPTIAYIKNDTLGLNLGGTKSFYDVTVDKFKKVATNAKASERLTARIVNETIADIHHAWIANRFNLLLPGKVRQDIDAHMNKLSLFKQTTLLQKPGSLDSLALVHIAIASIEYDPIIDERTMILAAPTGRTTAVEAPERMEPDLIRESAQKGLLLESNEGPIRIFVGEKHYRQWRRIQFITIDSNPLIVMHPDFAQLRGEAQTLQGEYSPDAWQKIVSAHQRQSMEEFDVIQHDGSIRNFKARVEKISDIARLSGSDTTKASVQLLVQNENVILDPTEGISYLLSDFEKSELQQAVETTLHNEGWEQSFFSEPKRLVTRKTVHALAQDDDKSVVPLEAEIIFQEDERKTYLLIKVRDLEARLGWSVHEQARHLRQSILELLAGPD